MSKIELLKFILNNGKPLLIVLHTGQVLQEFCKEDGAVTAPLLKSDHILGKDLFKRLDGSLAGPRSVLVSPFEKFVIHF